MSGSRSLRLFLSADLAGATAYKQKSAKPYEWQFQFREFYRQLPAFVAKEAGLSSNRLHLWKTIGDEIVFSARLQSSEEVPKMVQGFRLAVAEYRRFIRDEKVDLDIKCAGWTAGFPVGNLEVALPVQGMGFDYIGPCMDIGFRLVQAASPRRFLLSVELAYILTLSAFNDPEICVGRSLELKGVGKGHRYPSLWLDAFRSGTDREWDHLEIAEESLRGVPRRPATQEKVHGYCDAWLSAIGQPFVKPFIDGDALIGTRPPKYDERLAELTTQTQQLPRETPAEKKEARRGKKTASPREFTLVFKKNLPTKPKRK